MAFWLTPAASTSFVIDIAARSYLVYNRHQFIVIRLVCFTSVYNKKEKRIKDSLVL